MNPEPQFLEAGGNGSPVRRVAYMHAPANGSPGLFWLCGFNSTMTGSKATAVASWAAKRRLPMLRFDYSGHGQSEGELAEGTIGRWLEDSAAMLRQASGPQVLIGSSMGGWIALLLLRAIATRAPLARGLPAIRGAVLIAPAWDMTEELIWKQMSDEVRATIATQGVWMRPSAYGDGPYPITAELIEEGRRHLIADTPFTPPCPVRIIQGLLDADVPWQHANRLTRLLGEANINTLFIPDGDHRLSREEDIEKLINLIAEFRNPARGAG